MVLIFCDVGEMRKIGKGTNNLYGLFRREIVQKRLQLAARGSVGIPMEANGGLADLLDKIEDRPAFLFPNCVAQNASQQSNIGA